MGHFVKEREQSQLKKLATLVRVARGEAKADLYLKGGTVLNVYSGELLKAGVAAQGDRIAYIGKSESSIGRGTEVMDVSGQVLVPGYIEPHAHPWVIAPPVELASAVLPLGTTTMVCDNLFFYLLMGTERFLDFAHALKEIPIRLLWVARIQPQAPMEREDEVFAWSQVDRLLADESVVALAEITRWPLVYGGDESSLHKVLRARQRGKRVDGHTAGASYEKLVALAAAGIQSCHEAIDQGQAEDRLRLGLYTMLRESSLRPDLRGLLKIVTERGVSTHRLMMTTDGPSPYYVSRHGFSDNLVRIALEEGVDPIRAYQMVTLNPATYFGLDSEIGGIAPGRMADILVLNDLKEPRPEVVIASGRRVASKGSLVTRVSKVNWSQYLPGSTQTNDWHAEASLFSLPKEPRPFPAVRLMNAVITRKAEVHLPQEVADSDLPEGFLRIALLDWNGRWASVGLVQGFANRLEGFASSYNTAVKILAVGNSSESMAMAVNRVLELHGGIVLVEGGQNLYEFPLEIGGMMTSKPFDWIARKSEELFRLLSDRGYLHNDPIYTLCFLPSDFLPEIRVNYHGIFNVKSGQTLVPRRDLFT
jgi:adenine deaminase